MKSKSLNERAVKGSHILVFYPYSYKALFFLILPALILFSLGDYQSGQSLKTVIGMPVVGGGFFCFLFHFLNKKFKIELSENCIIGPDPSQSALSLSNLRVSIPRVEIDLNRWQREIDYLLANEDSEKRNILYSLDGLKSIQIIYFSPSGYRPGNLVRIEQELGTSFPFAESGSTS